MHHRRLTRFQRVAGDTRFPLSLSKVRAIIGASVSNVSSVHYLLGVPSWVSNSSSVSILSVLYLICVPFSVSHHSWRVSRRSSSISNVVFRAPQEGKETGQKVTQLNWGRFYGLFERFWAFCTPYGGYLSPFKGPWGPVMGHRGFQGGGGLSPIFIRHYLIKGAPLDPSRVSPFCKKMWMTHWMF